jgi:hypothetical protein
MKLAGLQLAAAGATADDLDALDLPEDLRAFLREHDGGQGELGGRPIELWSAARIAREAESQEVALAIPELRLFGSDGGAEGYGHLRGRYGRIPLLAAGPHEFEALADSLQGLLDALSHRR